MSGGDAFSVYGYNLGLYKSVELSEEDTERLYSIANKYHFGYSDFSTFTEIDKDVAFCLYEGEYDRERVDKYGEGYYSNSTYIFPRGKVPADIKALLG